MSVVHCVLWQSLGPYKVSSALRPARGTLVTVTNDCGIAAKQRWENASASSQKMYNNFRPLTARDKNLQSGGHDLARHSMAFKTGLG